jgi:type I restriction enzyme S subunit
MKPISDILTRNKTSVTVEDGTRYRQVTIRTNYKGVVLRGTQDGSTIATKKQFSVSAGQFILSRIDARNGAFGIVPDELEGAIVTNDFLAFDINEDEVEREFFNIFLQSPVFLEACIKASRGNTNRKRVEEDFFLNFQVNLPPLPRQRQLIKQISKCRTDVSTVQNELRRQKALLENLKQAILREAIQGKLTADWRADHRDIEAASQLLSRIHAEKARLVAAKKIRPEKLLPKITVAKMPFEIPKSWEWCRLGAIGMDVSYGTSQKAHTEAKGIPVLRMGNVTVDGRITYKDLKYVSPRIKDLPRLFLRSGDIIFNRTNSYELVGKSAVFRQDQEFTLASYLIRIRLFEKLIPEYVAYLINSSICRTMFIEPDIIQQNGQANFNGTKLKTIPIPLPPVAEQAVIVERVEALMTTCHELEVEIERSRIRAAHLLQAILRDAFTIHKAESSHLAVTRQNGVHAYF